MVKVSRNEWSQFPKLGGQRLRIFQIVYFIYSNYNGFAPIERPVIKIDKDDVAEKFVKAGIDLKLLEIGESLSL